MNKQFTYSKTKTLEPRPGTKYATTYYQMHPSEYVKLQEFVKNVCIEVMNSAEHDEDYATFIMSPLPGFKRTMGLPNYSIEQILIDTLAQLQAGKDISQGMLGRWNRVFFDTRFDFSLKEGSPFQSPTNITPARLSELFK